MKKVLTLVAVVCALGATWAVATPPAPQDTQTTPSQTHQEMGGKHGRMHGMMQQHASKEGHEHGKGDMHGKEMMACDMSAHGAGQQGHQIGRAHV